MSDEPREKHSPEEEEVEAHLLNETPLGTPLGEAHRGDDEDVEAHSVPIGAPLPKPDAPLP